MAQPSRAVQALCSILAGAAAGTAIGTVGVWIGKELMMSGSTAVGDPRNVVFLGNGLGIVVSLFVTWTSSAGLIETWRRAAMAFVAAMGGLAGGMASFPMSMLSIMSANPLVPYLVPAYLVLAIVVAVACFRIAKRHRQLLMAGPSGT